jgi:uncharacterized protein
MRSLIKRAGSLATIFVIGCSSVLAPPPDLAKFFVLTPAPSRNQPAAASTGQLAIGLGPVKLPDYLDRNEIVTRVEPNRLDLSENDRWAEPVEANFRHVLAADLASQLPNAQIVPFPWYDTTRLDFAVEVTVERFERDTSGNARLVAHWTVHEAAGGKLLTTRDSNLSDPAKSAAMADSVAAMSTAIEDLGVQIASEVRRLSNQTRFDASSYAG